jgi:predicted lipoprotein with Yx(FWY)xxD motif
VTTTRNFRALALLALLMALALNGCGSDGSGGGYGGTSSSEADTGTTAASAPASSGAFVSLGSVPGVGSVLVNADGLTLYDFHKDKGTVPSCYGACAGVWPPLLTDGAPRPSNGASAAKLGTTKRKDGSVQVTYAGHPLYTYAADKRPGEAKGHDIDSFGAEWYALTASGAEAED